MFLDGFYGLRIYDLQSHMNSFMLMLQYCGDNREKWIAIFSILNIKTINFQAEKNLGEIDNPEFQKMMTAFCREESEDEEVT
jgi:hypothetical protein